MAKRDRRLLELESRTGGDNIFAVFWGDGLITVNGETISIDEFDRRYPDHKVVTRGWGDEDEKE